MKSWVSKIKISLCFIMSIGLVACGDSDSSNESMSEDGMNAMMGPAPLAPNTGTPTAEPMDEPTTLPSNPSTPVDEPGPMMGNTPEPQPNVTPEPGQVGNRPPITAVDLTLAHRYMMGRFDTKEQASNNPAYPALQFWSCEVTAPNLGGRVLYVEEADSATPEAPFQQRLYVFKDNGDGRIVIESNAINDPTPYVGLCSRQQRPRFSVTDLTRLSGCDLFIAPSDGEFAFDGGTEGTQCGAGRSEAAYETINVIASATELNIWRKGLDAAGQQVTGTTAGASIYTRSVEANPTPGGGSNPDPASNNGQPQSEIPDEVFLEGGETCEDAVQLADASQPLQNNAQGYTHRIISLFGQSNDYNAHQDSGMEPGCALVYDAIGNDVVFRVTLQPDQVLDMMLTMGPDTSAGGIYMMDGCQPVSVPDLDGNGICGSDTYASQGACDFGCDPMRFEFAWPVTSLAGVRNQAQDFYLVVDEIVGDRAQLFVLDWRILN